METIRFDNVCYKLIKDLSFNIPSKSIVSLYGDVTVEMISKLIMGFNQLEYGEIIVDGKKINKRNIRNIQNTVGYLFDDPYDFLTNKTVRKEIEFGLKYLGFKNINKRIKDSIDQLNINECILNKKSLELSRDIQRKVMLAAILAIEPKTLILNNVDKFFNEKDKKLIKKILVNLKNNGTNIILIGNNTNFYYDIVDYLMIFKNGELIKEGSRDIFYEENISKYIDEPEIINFIKMFNKKSVTKLYKTNDIKELMKDLYRVKNNMQR